MHYITTTWRSLAFMLLLIHMNKICLLDQFSFFGNLLDQFSCHKNVILADPNDFYQVLAIIISVLSLVMQVPLLFWWP